MMPARLLTLALVLVVAPAIACGSRGKGADFATLTLDEVEAMLGKPDVVVVDANERDLYEKHHLPGARFAGSKLASVLPEDKETRLVFYCTSPK
jgi:rhodanese-related sulfurtransferase